MCFFLETVSIRNVVRIFSEECELREKLHRVSLLPQQGMGTSDWPEIWN